MPEFRTRRDGRVYPGPSHQVYSKIFIDALRDIRAARTLGEVDAVVKRLFDYRDTMSPARMDYLQDLAFRRAAEIREGRR